MKKRVVLTALSLAFAVAAAGSSLAEEAKDTLVFGITQLGDTDPMSWTMTYQYWFDSLIYDKLVNIDPETGEAVPEFATDWEVAEDGSDIVFTIRTDAQFHDGTPVTSEDVAFSIETALTSPYLTSYFANVTGAEALDDATVKVSTSEYNKLNLNNLAYAFIVPKAQYGEESFAQAPVGSGPFAVDSIDSVQKIYTLARNENYWGEKSALSSITFREISDASTRVVALEKGEIDMSVVFASDYNTVAANTDLEIADSDPNTFSYLTMNTEQAPFDNVLVRQAINYALDRDSIMLVATGGVNSYPESVFNPASWGIDSSDAITYEYDPEKASALLEEAGVSVPLDLGTMQIIASSKTAAEMVKQNLEDIGVTITLEQTEVSDWLGGLITGNYVLGLMGSYDMLEGSLLEVAASTSIDNMNFSRFADAELDESISGYYTLRDANERAQAGKRAVEILQEQVPYAVLYSSGSSLAYRKGLKIDTRSLMFMDLEDCSWE